MLGMLGGIDIYLFDQIVRGRIHPEMRILDAGCGAGRNARYLMGSGADVFGVDTDAAQIAAIRAMASEVAPDLPSGNFAVASIVDLPFPDGYFDAVVCSAVLHFASDEAEFEAMLAELWRVLATGGLFFARLASTIGIEGRVVRRDGRRCGLPDGSERFLVDEPYLLQLGDALGGVLVDPIKTTNVQNMRAMTTWVLRSRGLA
jgi:SAM-dependent methyltransferase